ncbi:MAG: MmcQ/YjbR family DNA-binding protein [Clostridiales bacterium]|nr:MmcQ/YjbR family DNA-binding protein [Clostridiales bacterium]
MNRQQIIDYIKEEYGTGPAYLWKSHPSYAVFRHQSSGKWFGIIMDVSRNKLGLPGTGNQDILNLKGIPEKFDLLRQSHGFLPAYHMNKTLWISILLDGSVSENMIKDLLDESYHLTGTKATARQSQRAGETENEEDYF